MNVFKMEIGKRAKKYPLKSNYQSNSKLVVLLLGMH